MEINTCNPQKIIHKSQNVSVHNMEASVFISVVSVICKKYKLTQIHIWIAHKIRLDWISRDCWTDICTPLTAILEAFKILLLLPHLWDPHHSVLTIVSDVIVRLLPISFYYTSLPNAVECSIHLNGPSQYSNMLSSCQLYENNCLPEEGEAKQCCFG